MAGCNVFAPCHFSMGANTLHLGGGERFIQTVTFVCKADRVQELTDGLPHAIRQSPVRVVKEIRLTQAQYRRYAAHLGEKVSFITANRALMGMVEDGVTRCLLVTARSRRDGILIDPQGYPATWCFTWRIPMWASWGAGTRVASYGSYTVPADTTMW